MLGKEKTIAARLAVQALDARLAYLETLPSGARFSGLTRPDGYERLVALLRSLAKRTHARDCLLVYMLDLLLLAMEVDERERFWAEILVLPYPRTKLILTIPEKAPNLFSFELRRRYHAQIAEGFLEQDNWGGI